LGIELKNGQRDKNAGRSPQTAWLVAALPLLAPKKWEQAYGMARRSVSNEEKSTPREKAIEQKAVRNPRQIVGCPGK
jgi:hypothetical protein